MDKIKKKLNNSASLGKTLARTSQQQHHFSYFAEPKEFDSVLDPRDTSQRVAVRRQVESTPKLSPSRIMLSHKFSVAESLAKIQNSRIKCHKIGQNIQTSFLQKSLKLNKLYKEMHHFSINVDQLKWLLSEGNTLIQNYFSKTLLISPQSTHTRDISNIAKQFKSLLLRFGQIERGKMIAIQDFLKNERIDKMEEFDTIGLIHLQQSKINPEGKIPCFSENVSIITKQRQGKQSRNTSLLQPKCFQYKPMNNYLMKENINSSNFTTKFQNIKLLKPQKTTQKINKKQQNDPIITTAQSIKEKDQDLQRQKQQLYSKLHDQHGRYEQLMGRNQLLKDQIASLQSKIIKYKTASYKSTQALADILKRLIEDLTKQEKQFELLKMAQCINTWQKMMEDEQQEARYRELYGNPEVMQGQRTQKLQQIIQLQYDINNLLGQKKQLKNNQRIEDNRKLQRQTANEDMYRMIAMQAYTLQQICKL